jgi:hypothetical protein
MDWMDKYSGSKTTHAILLHLLQELVSQMSIIVVVRLRNKLIIVAPLVKQSQDSHVKIGQIKVHILTAVLLRIIPAQAWIVIIVVILMARRAPGATPVIPTTGGSCVMSLPVIQLK